MKHFKSVFVNDMFVRQITKTQALALPKGAVMIVRSNYKNEAYGDHLAVITGGTIRKERGLRPNLVTLPGSYVENITQLLNSFKEQDGAILLLIDQSVGAKILNAIGVHVSDGELVEVESIKLLKDIFKD